MGIRTKLIGRANYGGLITRKKLSRYFPLYVKTIKLLRYYWTLLIATVTGEWTVAHYTDHRSLILRCFVKCVVKAHAKENNTWLHEISNEMNIILNRSQPFYCIVLLYSYRFDCEKLNCCWLFNGSQINKNASKKISLNICLNANTIRSSGHSIN